MKSHFLMRSIQVIAGVIAIASVALSNADSSQAGEKSVARQFGFIAVNRPVTPPPIVYWVMPPTATEEPDNRAYILLLMLLSAFRSRGSPSEAPPAATEAPATASQGAVTTQTTPKPIDYSTWKLVPSTGCLYRVFGTYDYEVARAYCINEWKAQLAYVWPRNGQMSAIRAVIGSAEIYIQLDNLRSAWQWGDGSTSGAGSGGVIWAASEPSGGSNMCAVLTSDATKALAEPCSVARSFLCEYCP